MVSFESSSSDKLERAYREMIDNKNYLFWEGLLKEIKVENSGNNIRDLHRAFLEKIQIFARENGVVLPADPEKIVLSHLDKFIFFDIQNFAKDFFTSTPEIDVSGVQSVDSFFVSISRNLNNLLDQASVSLSQDIRIKARDLIASHQELLLDRVRESGDALEKVVIDFLRNNKDFLEKQDS